MPLRNPLTMRGTIDRCWLFTYGTPTAEAQRLLPPQLEPVTHNGSAFWNIVVCRIRAMRPKWITPPLGVHYWHVAYRLYVRFHPLAAEPIEGLYFLRSDCDNRLMAALGNLLTDFHFHTAGVDVQESQEHVRISIASEDAPAQVLLDRFGSPQISPNSAFRSLEEAATFLKYKPFGISIDPAGRANIVQIVRDEAAWQSRLLPVESAEWAFFTGRPVMPEICYEVQPIAYQWNRGRLWNPRI